MSTRLNEPFIAMLDQLATIMLKQGEPFRARAYQKAQETLMTYSADIWDPAVLKGLPGIGGTIMEKFQEYATTGTLQVLEREKANPVNILTDVYGIGPKKAKDLVDNGIVSIAQLREPENYDLLNDVQKVGLHYYEDILKRIPREEIEIYKQLFETTFTNCIGVGLGSGTGKMEIVGSYRRGAQTSGDIDVIITSESSKTFSAFIDNLIKSKIIIHVLSKGQSKCLVIAQLPSMPARRVDFLYTGPKEFPFAILYFTGSKMFNTVMRHIALEQGYTMNEHGLYHMDEERNKGCKVLHTFESEQDIFAFLKLEYKGPTERTDGRAVKYLTAKEGPKTTIEKQKPKPNSSKTPKKRIQIEDDDESILANIASFKAQGISFLHSLKEFELVSLLRYANDAYYNTDTRGSLLTDNQFDIIKEYIENMYPTNPEPKKIGAPATRITKLPYPMGSMDKIKPDTDALAKWSAKYRGPYVLSCKLDGVSGLYTTEGAVPQLFTRGDGIEGQDISHLIPYLRLPKVQGITIRGEFIISKDTFEAKYKGKFANPRNMVSGLINHKTINEAIHDLHFVAYEVLHPVLCPSTQLNFLSSLDVEVVMWTRKASLTNSGLSEHLVGWRSNHMYEIDGVIVANDDVYERKSGGNPDHAFAFKMVLSDQIAEAKVLDVIWTPSKDGYLKPRVQIEPIQLCGVRIEYATGFNGAFIRDTKIGVGAMIMLIRSGDVIPHITSVSVPAEEAKMPSVPYVWTDTGVDVVLADMDTNETVKEKNITCFFRGIGVEGLSSGNVSRIMQEGFDTVPKIVHMTMSDFLSVDGFKDKTASKLHQGIREKLQSASLITLMSASNVFGRGFSDKRLELIMEAYPAILTQQMDIKDKVNMVASIKGMAQKTAEAFVERIPHFIAFMGECGMMEKVVQASVPAPAPAPAISEECNKENHPLFGKSIVFTGVRDAELQEKLKKIGAKMGTSVSGKTYVVLAKSVDEDTGKAGEARRLGVPIMTLAVFKETFHL